MAEVGTEVRCSYGRENGFYLRYPFWRKFSDWPALKAPVAGEVLPVALATANLFPKSTGLASRLKHRAILFSSDADIGAKLSARRDLSI